jgi:hypothetical protein
MAVFYNTNFTSWLNQPKSYWVPVGAFIRALAYIRTVVVRAILTIGNKWVTTIYDVASEKTDIGVVVSENIESGIISEKTDLTIVSETKESGLTSEKTDISVVSERSD